MLAYASGEDKLHAAMAAGYQKGAGAKKAGSRLLKNPLVRQEIEAIHQAGRAAAGKTLADRIAQADEDRAFARENRNAMAAHKSTELQCRLGGYLIDRLQIEPPVDLRGALEAARGRVIDIVTLRQSREDSPAVPGGTRWLTPIPGNPLGDHVGSDPATDPGASVGQKGL